MEPKVDTIIQFSGLKCATYTFKYELGKDFLEPFKNENLSDCKVFFEVKLEKKERLLMFYFTFEGEVMTVCDRCLGEMSVPVSGNNTLCVKFSDTEVSDDEDVVFLPEKECKIDLAQWMYEYIAVAMPLQCVHADDEDGNPTCDPEMMKYITTESETEQNAEEEIDPRWAVLKNLK